jgi:putative hydrolase of the HAD superfamily
MTTVNSRKVSALLFDLGGVVIDIDLQRMLQHWLPHSRLTLEQMHSRLHPDTAYRLHERGELADRAYMAHLSEVFELETDLDTVAQGWNAMLVGQIDATLDLIDRIHKDIPCHAFSNTSAIHHSVWSSRFPRVTTIFDRLFLSFELGLRKPDREAFHAVSNELGLEPREILFFDDTADNIAGARRAGLQGVHVSGPADVARALGNLGLLYPD